jgi:hypothetical protein
MMVGSGLQNAKLVSGGPPRRPPRAQPESEQPPAEPGPAGTRGRPVHGRWTCKRIS